MNPFNPSIFTPNVPNIVLYTRHERMKIQCLLPWPIAPGEQKIKANDEDSYEKRIKFAIFGVGQSLGTLTIYSVVSYVIYPYAF